MITSRGFPTSRKIKMVYRKWFAGNLACGGAAGASALLIVYSLDYAHIRLANDDAKAALKGGDRQFKGLIDVYRKTLKSDGIAGLYRGFSISCVRIIVYRGLYFGMYDSLKGVLPIGSLLYSYDFGTFFVPSFAIAWPITYCARLASYPIDIVRRRMMMTSGEAVKYKSSLDAFSQILKNEGAKSLFKGAGANMVLFSIPGAFMLTFYDLIQSTATFKKRALAACMILFSLSLKPYFFALAIDAQPCHLNEFDPPL